jgi:CxxC motif-containing protein
MKKELTCIICPTSCKIIVSCKQVPQTNIRDNLIEVALPEVALVEEALPEGALIEGALCSKGKKYAIKEINCPTRQLSTTLEVIGGEYKLVSIKSDRELPKELIMPVMRQLAQIKLKAPIDLGQPVVLNVLDSGVNMIATRAVSKTSPK